MSSINEKKGAFMAKKMTQRQIKAAETRSKIYETAKALFTKYGYNAVSIDDIVKEAGVARGSFYVYFLSKEDLSIYMMFDGLGDVQNKVIDYFNKLDKNLSATELMVEIACSISAMTQSMSIETVRTMYKIFIERSATTGSSHKNTFDMPFLFEELYDRGLKSGEFIETDSVALAENIKTIMVGLTLEWCLYNTEYDYVGRTRSVITEYLKGIKAN